MIVELDGPQVARSVPGRFPQRTGDERRAEVLRDERYSERNFAQVFNLCLQTRREIAIDDEAREELRALAIVVGRNLDGLEDLRRRTTARLRVLGAREGEV